MRHSCHPSPARPVCLAISSGCSSIHLSIAFVLVPVIVVIVQTRKSGESFKKILVVDAHIELSHNNLSLMSNPPESLCKMIAIAWISFNPREVAVCVLHDDCDAARQVAIYFPTPYKHTQFLTDACAEAQVVKRLQRSITWLSSPGCCLIKKN